MRVTETEVRPPQPEMNQGSTLKRGHKSRAHLRPAASKKPKEKAKNSVSIQKYFPVIPKMNTDHERDNDDQHDGCDEGVHGPHAGEDTGGTPDDESNLPSSTCNNTLMRGTPSSS